MPYRMRSIMNDPAFAYGKVYGPTETLEKSITLLQARLAKARPETLTMEYLDSQYSGLFDMLVDSGLCVVTAHQAPMIAKDVWLRHQLSSIARYRD